jgi:hypothetical protein
LTTVIDSGADTVDESTDSLELAGPNPAKRLPNPVENATGTLVKGVVVVRVLGTKSPETKLTAVTVPVKGEVRC